MSPSELSHMLNVALRDLESAISLTLTSFSADSDQLQKLLITALAAGRRHNVQLKEIELPLRDFPTSWATIPQYSDQKIQAIQVCCACSSNLLPITVPSMWRLEDRADVAAAAFLPSKNGSMIEATAAGSSWWRLWLVSGTNAEVDLAKSFKRSSKPPTSRASAGASLRPDRTQSTSAETRRKQAAHSAKRKTVGKGTRWRGSNDHL